MKRAGTTIRMRGETMTFPGWLLDEPPARPVCRARPRTTGRSRRRPPAAAPSPPAKTLAVASQPRRGSDDPERWDGLC